MKQILRGSCALLWALIFLTVPLGAIARQCPPPPPVAADQITFSRQQLDQMLAPIALYPDSLLAQILLAATWPDQVMAADHWLKEHQGLRGPGLNEALDSVGWDLSVKALAPFPRVMDMMAQEPEWTRKLGQAFLAQQIQVMESIQRLRRAAREAGNLKTSAEQRILVRGDCVEILPANPEVVYVPRYNPVAVYGAWWWPAYPPLAYYPVWPGVVVSPVVGIGFWGFVSVGPVWGWGWGSWGWATHTVLLNVNRSVNINNVNVAVFRSSFQTTSLQAAVMSGRFGGGSATWSGAGAAVARLGRGGARAGYGWHGAGYRTRGGGFHGHGFSRRWSAGAAIRGHRGGGFRPGYARGGRGKFGGKNTLGRFGTGRSFGKGAGFRGRAGRAFAGRRGGFGRARFARRGAGRSFGTPHASFGGRGAGFGRGFRRGGGVKRTSARAAGGRGRR